MKYLKPTATKIFLDGNMVGMLKGFRIKGSVGDMLLNIDLEHYTDGPIKPEKGYYFAVNSIESENDSMKIHATSVRKTGQ